MIHRTQRGPEERCGPAMAGRILVSLVRRPSPRHVVVATNHFDR
jgi:hypothetical protein